MNLHNRIYTFIVLLTAMYVSGCATTSSLVETPEVTLKSVQMKSMSFDSQNFVLAFAVSNPNAFPLPVRSIRYHLRLGEHRFASGETQSDFTVPANGDESFAISVNLDILQQTAQITSLLRTGMRENVEYELEGSLVVDVPLAPTLNFSNAGEISVANGL